MNLPCDISFITLYYMTPPSTLADTVLVYWETLCFVERSHQMSGISLRIIQCRIEDNKGSGWGAGKESHLRGGLSSALWSDSGEIFTVFTFALKLFIHSFSKYIVNTSLNHWVARDPFMPGISIRLTGAGGGSHHLTWNCFATWTSYKSSIWPMISSHSTLIILHHR